MSSIHPADEFEHPDPDMPVGTHRRPPSRWGPVVPFLIILAAIPLLAWGFSALLQRGGSGSDVVAQSEVVEVIPQSDDVLIVEETDPADTGDQSADASDENQPSSALDDPADKPESETPEEPEEPEKSEEVDYGTYVLVLNQTLTEGYAGEIAGILDSDGFTNTAADNTWDWITEVNTVFYSTEDEKATAEKVAELTGISEVVMNADATGGDGIVILLVN